MSIEPALHPVITLPNVEEGSRGGQTEGIWDRIHEQGYDQWKASIIGGPEMTAQITTNDSGEGLIEQPEFGVGFGPQRAKFGGDASFLNLWDLPHTKLTNFFRHRDKECVQK